jgi:hypothetical protein
MEERVEKGDFDIDRTDKIKTVQMNCWYERK